MAFTVTATPGGASFNRGVDLLVRVLTNATEAGGASAGGATASAATPGGSLTPTFSNSFVAFSVTGDGVTTLAAAAANNTYDFSATGHFDTWASRMGHYSGTVTGGTPLTYGASGAGADDHENHCAYEVPASGGTITVDGSSPVGVFSDTGTSATTASFTPPAGSVLVVMVAAGGSGAGAGVTCTISDTSGLGLVWTQRKTSSTSDNFQPTFIFTATVPQPTQSGQQAADSWGGRRWQPQLARTFGPGQPFVEPGSGVYYAPPPPSPPGVPPPPPTPLPPARATGLPGMPGGTAFSQYPGIGETVGNPDPPYIAGLAGTNYGQYFVDNLGNPVLVLSEQAWALPWNAGRWNGGNWQYDYSEYFSARQKAGYNAWYGVPYGTAHVDSTALSGGRTWDGIYPLTVNGTPGAISSTGQTVGLNEPFWARFAAMVDTARSHGITCFANLSMAYNVSDVGGIWAAAGNTQATAFGAALAARFPISRYPNLQWFFGDDDDGPNDSFYQAILTGIQGAGDTRTLISIEQFTNTNSHIDFATGSAYSGSFGVPNATYNYVYAYDAPYFGIERSYTEGGTFPKIPPIYGDGVYYGDTGAGTTAERAIRNFAWWALASGARGFTATSGPSDLGGGGLWTWQADATTRLRSDPNGAWCTSTAGAIRAFLTRLADFQNLIPDTSNVFITAGRGTRGTSDAAGGAFNFRTTNNYVAGAITPNGTLAVIYCKAAMSITIDETKLGSGYTATWVDPSSLATTTTATGPTYSSSGLGNNSAGDPDWVLVLQGPAVAGNLSATATIPLTDTVTSAAQVGKVAAATVALAFAVTATAVVGTSSGATVPLADTVTSTAQVGVSAGATIPLTYTTTSTAQVGTVAAATIPLVFGVTSAAQAGTSSGSSIPLVFGVTSTASVTSGLSGTVAIALAYATTATAQVGVSNGATVPLVFGATPAGQVGVSSGSSIPLVFGVTAAAQVGKVTATSVPLVFGVTSTATVTSGLTGDVAIPLVYSTTSTAQVGKVAAAAIPLAYSTTAAGQVGIFTTTTVPLTYATTSSAQVGKQSTATVAATFAITAAASVDAFGSSAPYVELFAPARVGTLTAPARTGTLTADARTGTLTAATRTGTLTAPTVARTLTAP